MPPTTNDGTHCDALVGGDYGGEALAHPAAAEVADATAIDAAEAMSLAAAVVEEAQRAFAAEADAELLASRDGGSLNRDQRKDFGIS